MIKETTFKPFLCYFRDEYEEFIGEDNLDINSRLLTLEEQIMRYAKHLAFWCMKKDQLEKKNEKGEKMSATKLEIERTMNVIKNIFPNNVLITILNMVGETRKIHNHLIGFNL